MTKTLVAQENAVSRIFSDDYVFRIPGYQRPYAWTTEQARELFDDLLGFMQDAEGAVDEMPPYFLGSIVLIKNETAPDADVVDGQQRLTTLTILLATIRAYMTDEEAAMVTSLLYERGNAIRGTRDRFRLTLRDRDQDFFQNYVQKEGGFRELLDLTDELSDSQTNIRANAQLFWDRMAALPAAERLRLAQFTVTRCYLVVVATPDLDSAYRIFSVLNSRGLDLSATDILKATIIGEIAEARRDSYTKKWEDIEEDIGREAFGDLFSHIRMVYRKAKPKGTLLKEFKDHVTDLSNPEHFISGVLLPMAKAYGELLDASYTSTANADAVNEHLKWLNRLEFTDWVPPALAFATRYRQNNREMLAFFRDLERLAYAMLIAKVGINQRIERFSRLTQEIEAGKDLHVSSSALQLTDIEQTTVYTQLDGPLYETLAARARSVVLLRLDALLSGGGATYDHATVTVEHVLPQRPSHDSKWVEWFPNGQERTDWTHRIGNLALLTRKKNSAASNYEFDVKKKTYFVKDGVSPFALTTQVLGQEAWTPDAVKERQTQLCGLLERHWRLEERHA